MNYKKILNIIVFMFLMSLGVLIILIGLKAHVKVVESFNCKTCSVFDEECPEGYDTKENMECLDFMEPPWKFSLFIIFFGVMMILSQILLLFLNESTFEKDKTLKN